MHHVIWNTVLWFGDLCKSKELLGVCEAHLRPRVSSMAGNVVVLLPAIGSLAWLIPAAYLSTATVVHKEARLGAPGCMTWGASQSCTE